MPTQADRWFTSDTHFGHRMLVEKRHRPYSSVEEMDEDLIDRWNEVVKPGDVVWHLGDFGMGRVADYLPIVHQLNGHIQLVTGNHDRPWPGNRDSWRHQGAWFRAGFESVQAFARVRVQGVRVLMSHFPYEGDHTDDERASAYRLRDTGEWLLHGHVHDAWAQRGRQINVGVDVRDFRPVHLDELAAIVKN